MNAVARPFQSLSLEGSALEKLPVAELLDQLRGEDSLSTTGRASLTLIHSRGLTVVLTLSRGGTVFDDHEAGGPTVVVVLRGELHVTASSAGSEATRLLTGEMFAIGREVRHVLEAQSECAFLTIIGEQID
jgi:quercetin dioxygenase-like cupin family protein